jgi:hypothetical protein
MRRLALVIVVLVAGILVAPADGHAGPLRVRCRDGVAAEPVAGIVCDAREGRDGLCAFRTVDCPPCWPTCKIKCGGLVLRVGQRSVVRRQGRSLILRCKTRPATSS